jgi:hypothetical protein
METLFLQKEHREKILELSKDENFLKQEVSIVFYDRKREEEIIYKGLVVDIYPQGSPWIMICLGNNSYADLSFFSDHYAILKISHAFIKDRIFYEFYLKKPR